MQDRFMDVIAWSVAMSRYYKYRSKVCSKETENYYKKMAEIYSLLPNLLARFTKDFEKGKAIFDYEVNEERGDND